MHVAFAKQVDFGAVQYCIFAVGVVRQYPSLVLLRFAVLIRAANRGRQPVWFIHSSTMDTCETTLVRLLDWERLILDCIHVPVLC